MVGVIWFVQIVHYPMFAAVPGPSFVAFERLHVRRTTLVVAPLMLVEAGTAAWLCWTPPVGTGVLPMVGMLLLLMIWSATFLLQVPCHNRLARGFDAPVHARLVRTNWIRTVIWTVRGILALVMFTSRH